MDYDLNRDGNVTENELELQQRIIELENRDKKEDQQRRMAGIAMFSMLILTVFLLLPVIDVERITALSDIFGMFYIAMAGIVAAFFGSAAYMSINR